MIKMLYKHTFNFLLYPLSSFVIVAREMKHFVLVQFECSSRHIAFALEQQVCCCTVLTAGKCHMIIIIIIIPICTDIAFM
jgi:hypothetical protein